MKCRTDVGRRDSGVFIVASAICVSAVWIGHRRIVNGSRTGYKLNSDACEFLNGLPGAVKMRKMTQPDGGT